jgi:hypothetical protein
MNGKRLVEFARATLIAAALALPTAQPAASVLEPRATLTTATGSLKAALEIDGKSRGYLRITDASGSVVERPSSSPIARCSRSDRPPLVAAMAGAAGLGGAVAGAAARSDAGRQRSGVCAGQEAYGEEIALSLTGKAGAAGERAYLLFVTGCPIEPSPCCRMRPPVGPQRGSWDQ